MSPPMCYMCITASQSPVSYGQEIWKSNTFCAALAMAYFLDHCSSKTTYTTWSYSKSRKSALLSWENGIVHDLQLTCWM